MKPLQSIIRLAGVLPLLGAHDAGAQEAGVAAVGLEPDRVLVVTPGALPPTNAVVHVVSGEARVVGEAVTGKPYCADSITETIQTLADGNRIVTTNTSRICRDSAGRTRQEQTLSRLGSWPAGVQPVTMVTIDDPVAQVSWFLDPQARTARQLRPYRFEAVLRDAEVSEDGVVANGVVVRRLSPPTGATSPAAAGFEPATPMIATGPIARSLEIGLAPSTDVRTEDLGEQTLQGVRARGTRQIQTIAAGAIGNEWPIEIVTETWYSEELEALMSRRTSDPRFGETVYRLVNVVRAEPPAELFEVPQDYEVSSAGASSAASGFGIATPGERVDLRIVRPESD
ncbi:MAG TPA: hypothetical protein VF339_16945 [Gammaproteobacteria bacterium]